MSSPATPPPRVDDGGRGTSSARRPDLQGLRAVAVTLVLVYHLWPRRLPGGFVGVDVFFVISGYLIGGHLVAEIERTGHLRLGRFWARRAKRLLPASLLVLAVTAVAIVSIAPLSTRATWLDQVVASVFYVQNWALAAASVDYLAATDAVSPVQHFWTLSVEEQFYVGLPLLLLAVAALSRRPPRRRTLAVVLTGVAAASLAYSLLATATDAGPAYFSTATRAWEFLAGALLGCLALQLPQRARVLTGAIGLGVIGLAAVSLSAASPFPGYLAALPVAGALAVILADGRGPVAWASRWRPVSWLGDVSYAVYLWHWPLIVLVPYATGHALTLPQKLAVGVVALVLAGLSTTYLENPVRFHPRLLGDPRRALVVGAVCLVASAVVAGSATVAAMTARDEQRELQHAAQEVVASGDLRCLGAGVTLGASTPGPPCADLGDVLVPDPSSVRLDDGNRIECWATLGDAQLRLCSLGPKAGAAMRVLAVGDSHNNMYLPAYEQLAAQRGWRIDVAGRAGCSWSEAYQDGTDAAIAAECQAWKERLTRHLADTQPYDLILTTTSRVGFLAIPGPGETATQATVDGLSDAWSAQIARGTRVIALDDVPIARRTVVTCVERLRSTAATDCARRRAAALGGFDALRAAVKATPGSALVSLNDALCARSVCRPVVGHVVVYLDYNHLTATYVRTLAPYLIERVVAAEKRLRGVPAA